MAENNWSEKGCEYWEKKEYEQAVECFREGDKEGDAECTANLGMCYYWGNGVEADLHKAAFYNEKAAKAGIPMAMYDTGQNYIYGYGVSQNVEKALYWLEKAADAEYADAMVTLGGIYYVGEFVEKDMEKSFHYYMEAERLGLKISKLFLADFYANGEVVEKDLEKAKKLYQEAYDYIYEQAALNNDTEAQFRLGSMFFFGRAEFDIDPDYVQAAEWYHKAVENGHHHAENTLGIMYYLGLGVGQNYEEAFKWFQKAAGRKNVAAIANMGKCYFLGRGVEKDLKKAADCHSQAANLGYANSQAFLGEMYMKGDGVDQNYTKAVYWLKKGCENGERSAFVYLGDCYRNGLGVEKDEKMAFELYQKGTNIGELQAKVAMAECLIEGWGTKCDLKQATQILQAICNDEEEYRENLIPMKSHEDESGHFFMENPLDELNLKHYAKAYYLLGKLYYADKGNGGANPSKAIAMLRMADKLGYEGEELSPEKIIDKIVEETEKEDVQDATDCHVEVKDEKDGRERYKVVLHHADGTESVVNFKGRNKFIYILALLIAKEGRSVCGLTTTHFSYMRDDLKNIADHLQVRIAKSYSEWIDEFIYAYKGEIYGLSAEEKKEHENEEYYSLFPYRYSNAFSGANRAIKACCKSDDEFETFKLRSTGGKNAITTMSLGFSQIKLPDSLMDYLDSLPTENDLAKHRVYPGKWMHIND